jgi:hypothetical protein
MNDPMGSDPGRFNFNTSDLDVGIPEWMDPTTHNNTNWKKERSMEQVI